MSIDALNGVIGQPAHFASDYLFRNVPLPNNTTITSEEYTFNNTLGRLQLVGTLDKSLALTGTNSLTVTLQYKSGTSWVNDSTLLSLSGVVTRSAGQIFTVIPVPSDTKRIYRLQVTSNFNASAINITAAVEILPIA